MAGLIGLSKVTTSSIVPGESTAPSLIELETIIGRNVVGREREAVGRQRHAVDVDHAADRDVVHAVGGGREVEGHVVGAVDREAGRRVAVDREVAGRQAREQDAVAELDVHRRDLVAKDVAVGRAGRRDRERRGGRVGPLDAQGVLADAGRVGGDAPGRGNCPTWPAVKVNVSLRPSPALPAREPTNEPSGA